MGHPFLQNLFHNYLVNNCVFLRFESVRKTGEVIVRDTVCQFSEYNKDGFNLGIQNFAGLQTHTEVFLTKHGCDSTVTLQLLVLPAQVPDFGIHVACDGHLAQVTLTNWSLVFDETNITGWNWFLGNELTPFATTKDASITLTETKNVTLQVIMKGGCMNKVTKEVEVECVMCPTDTFCVGETVDLSTLMEEDEHLTTPGAVQTFYQSDQITVIDPPVVTFTTVGDTLFFVQAVLPGCTSKMEYILIVVEDCPDDTS